MKKTFPIIIILITCSLLSIIYIQVSWIQSMIKVRQEQFGERVSIALQKASQKILALSSELTVVSKNNDFQIAPWMYDGEQKKNFLSQLNNVQLQDIIATSFKEVKINVPIIEYSVSSNPQSLNKQRHEMHSANFFKYFNTGELEYTLPIQPPSGSMLEGLVEGSIYVIIPNSKITIIKELGWMIFGALMFTLIIISAFYLTVTTLLKQKKISEIKSDFINNMTHEFKTPIATVSLAVDALRNSKVIGNEEKMNYFTSIIKEENKRMNKQVESILQAALLEKQELQLNHKVLKLNELVQSGFEHFVIMLEENKGTSQVQLNAKQQTILGDEVHITNLIRNLMDNAIKYAKPDTPLHIKISTASTRKMITLTIEDNGIGMTKETVQRIFEKFYRAHTGNVHNVKGFGLGLTYVKAIVDAHKGKIKVDSTLGKGSTFSIELPLHFS